jgi:hypothetical protein
MAELSVNCNLSYCAHDHHGRGCTSGYGRAHRCSASRHALARESQYPYSLDGRHGHDLIRRARDHTRCRVPPWQDTVSRGAAPDHRAAGRIENATSRYVCLLTMISGVGRAASNVRHARHRSGGSGKCTGGWDARRRIRGSVGGRLRHGGVGVRACRCRLATWCLTRS